MRHPEFPVVSLLIIPLLLSSLPSHLRTGSVCIIALIAWMTTLNLIHAINSFVWANNVDVRLEVWCDISTKILIGYTYAVPLSALCICRQLENISSNRQVRFSQSDRRRRMKLEAVLCLGVPILFMALHYVVQGHRFDIIEDFGCYPATYVSVAGLLLVWIPPLVISLTTMVYAVAALHHFLRRRIEFAAVLRKSNSAISPARYFRLMAFAIFEILWDTSTNIYVIYFNINLTGLRPWISWENVHSNFSRVGTFPNFLIPSSLMIQFTWQWWIIPISCIFFVIFFAFGEEAMADYRKAIALFCHAVLHPFVKPSGSAELPIYRVGFVRHITLSSTSDALSMHEPKAWDERPFKVQEAAERSLSTIEPSSPSSGDMPLTPLQRPDYLSVVHAPVPSETPSSISTSQSLPHSYHVPKATGTTPSASTPHAAVVSDFHTKTQMSGPCDRATSNSRFTDHRPSISTDFGITVSQAYLPDHGLASQYHEENILTPIAFGGVPWPPEALHAP